jgi:hypothetical protein
MFSQWLLEHVLALFVIVEIGLLAAAFILHLYRHDSLDEIDRTMRYGKFSEDSYHNSVRDLKLSGWIISCLRISAVFTLIAMIAGAHYRFIDLAFAALILFPFPLMALYKNTIVRWRHQAQFKQYLENTPWYVKVNLGLQEWECPFKKAQRELDERRALRANRLNRPGLDGLGTKTVLYSTESDVGP